MATKKDIAFIVSFDATKGTAQLKKVVGVTKKQLTALGKTAEKSGKGFTKMKKRVKESEKGMSGFKKMMKSTAVQMATGMGLMMGVAGAMRAVKDQIADTIRVGREFEAAWANVTTMLTISEDATAQMHDELLKMSPTLGDTTDLAKGMYQVLSASVEPSKAIMFLGEAAKSAQAGVTDTATAVDALTTVINAYGMEAEDVTAVSDIMFMAVKRGKLTYEEMAHSLGTVVPIAAQVNVGFEELAAGIATMTRQGIDARTATVQLRQILVSVLKPKQKAVEMAEKLGIQFSATALKAMGFAKWMKHVQERLGDNQEAAAALFSNVRALGGVMALGGAGAEGFAKDLLLMAKAQGSTETAFKKQMKSADFWMKTLKNAIGKVKISLYEGFVGPFKEGIHSSADLDRKIKELIDRGKEFGKTLGTIAMQFYKALKAMIEFAKHPNPFAPAHTGAKNLSAVIMKFLFPAYKTLEEKEAEFTAQMEHSKAIWETFGYKIQDIWEIFKQGEETWDKWRLNMTTQAETLKDVGTALKVDFENPMNAVIETQKILVIEMIKAGSTTEEIIAKFKELGIVLPEAGKGAEDAADKLSEAEKAMAALIQTAKGVGITTRTELVEQLKVAKTALQELDEAGQLTITGKEKLKKIISELTEELSGQTEALKELKPGLEGIQETIEACAEAQKKETVQVYRNTRALDYLEKISEGTSEAQQKATESAFGLTWEFMKEEKQTEKTAKAFKGLSKESVAALATISGAFRGMSDDIDGIWGDILSTAATAIDSISNALVAMAEKGKFSFKELAAAAGPALGQMAGQIGQAISGAKKSFAGIGQGLGSAAGQLIGGPIGKAIGGIVGGFVGGLFKKAETAQEKAERLLKERTESVTKALEHLGDVSEETAKAIAEDMGNGMSQAAATAKNYAQVIADVGVTQENVNELWRGSAEILSQYEQGTLSAAEASEAAGESFNQLVEGAQRLGTEGSKAMTAFIKKVKSSGLEVAEVTDYINDQLGVVKEGAGNAAEGLLAMAESVGTNEEALGRLERQSMAVFNAMIENGASMNEAMTALGPTLDIMAEQYEKLGITGGEGFERLLRIREVTEANQGLFNAIEGNLTVLSALANTGSLTQQSLNDAANSAKNYYNQLIDVGMTGNEALSSMAPTLERLRYLSEEHNLQLDAGTQELINQAEAAGVLGEEQASATDIMMAGFGEIIRALGGEIPAAFQKSIDKIKDMGDETSKTEHAMSILENTIAGQSVTSAVDLLGKTASDVLGKMVSDTGSAEKAMGKLEGGVTLTEDELKALGLEGRKWGDSLTTTIGDVDEGFEKMGKIAKGEFEGMVDHIGSVEGALGNLEKMAKQGFKINYEFQEKGGGGGGAKGAQHGVDETVTGPKTYYVEPGVREHVKITPVGKEGAGGGQTIIIEKPMKIQPLMVGVDELGNMLIEFLEEAAEDERFALPPRGLRRS